MELPSAPNTVRSFKGSLHHAEESLVGFSEETLLNPRGFKNVQNETFSHVANPSKIKHHFLNKLWLQFLSALSDGASL